MTPPDPPSDDELRKAVADAVSDPAIVDMFIAALQADQDHEAVYGWMAEESVEPSAADRLTHTDDAVRTIVRISDQA